MDPLGHAHVDQTGILRANVEILNAVERCTGKVIVGWGAHAADPRIAARVKRVLALLDGVPLFCLGTTKDNLPAHPLMLAYTTPLVPFEVRS